MSEYVAELKVAETDFVLYLTNGDFASGQRWLPMTEGPLAIGRFSEGQERDV